jgi:hypothetical protein
VEGGSRAVRGGWSTAVMWIQCFDFGSRVEATGDESDAVCSSWLSGKEAWHDVMAW